MTTAKVKRRRRITLTACQDEEGNPLHQLRVFKLYGVKNQALKRFRTRPHPALGRRIKSRYTTIFFTRQGRHCGAFRQSLRVRVYSRADIEAITEYGESLLGEAGFLDADEACEKYRISRDFLKRYRKEIHPILGRSIRTGRRLIWSTARRRHFEVITYSDEDLSNIDSGQPQTDFVRAANWAVKQGLRPATVRNWPKFAGWKKGRDFQMSCGALWVRRHLLKSYYENGPAVAAVRVDEKTERQFATAGAIENAYSIEHGTVRFLHKQGKLRFERAERYGREFLRFCVNDVLEEQKRKRLEIPKGYITTPEATSRYKHLTENRLNRAAAKEHTGLGDKKLNRKKLGNRLVLDEQQCERLNRWFAWGSRTQHEQPSESTGVTDATQGPLSGQILGLIEKAGSADAAQDPPRSKLGEGPADQATAAGDAVADQDHPNDLDEFLRLRVEILRRYRVPLALGFTPEQWRDILFLGWCEVEKLTRAQIRNRWELFDGKPRIRSGDEGARMVKLQMKRMRRRLKVLAISAD